MQDDLLEKAWTLELPGVQQGVRSPPQCLVHSQPSTNSKCAAAVAAAGAAAAAALIINYSFHRII